MFGDSTEFDILRKMVVVFGSLFSAVQFGRIDENGDRQIIKVPLTYAAKDKYLQRDENDPDIQRQFAALLPRMSFEMGTVTYDTTRKQTSVGRIFYTDPNSNSNIQYVYNPVPYNIQFKLYVYVKNAADGTKIVENILPYFTPDWTVNVELIAFTDPPEKRDIVISLNGVQLEDRYSGDYKDLRVMIWELDFTMKTYFFGRIHDKPLITFSIANIHDENSGIFETITVAANSSSNIGFTQTISISEILSGN